ncbi:MAG: hypothetical protein ACJA08_001264 [Cyclobacteriaceae bacterium]|jgi:hypothetical protein
MSLSKSLLSLLLILVFRFQPLEAQQRVVELVLDTAKFDLESSYYLDSLIDNRDFNSNVGLQYKGVMNSMTEVQLKGGFADHLAKTLTKVFPWDSTKSPISVSVNQFYTYEHLGQLAYNGIAIVELEFLKEVDEKLYILGSFESVVEGMSVVDVTPEHTERLLEATKNCVAKFIHDGSEKYNGVELKPFERNINFSEPEKFHSPAYGLYFNFKELFVNRPSNDSIRFDVVVFERNGKIISYQAFYHRKNKLIKNLYGFSDGNNFYLKAFWDAEDPYFIKSQTSGRYLCFEDRSFSGTATGIFGLAGMLATADLSIKALDRETGIVHKLNDTKMMSLLENHDQLLFEYQNGNKSNKFKIQLVSKLNLIISDPVE